MEKGFCTIKLVFQKSWGSLYNLATLEKLSHHKATGVGEKTTNPESRYPALLSKIEVDSIIITRDGKFM